ncbi:hypothetical protein ACFWPH_09050 [Nocardia sp. NPDC058499]|uniref:hypothetical protein n=1 Tax=Nocardia sp. NPDC058499 TaxID=3346530 RepID=UPI00365AF5BE
MFAFVTSPPEQQTHETTPPDGYEGGEMECDSEYATTGTSTVSVSTNMQINVEFSDRLTSSAEHFDTRRGQMQRGRGENGPVPGVGTDAYSDADIMPNGHGAYYTIVAWDSNAYISLYVLVGDKNTPVTRARLDTLFAPLVQNAFNSLRG